MCHMPHVTCQVSHVSCHVSGVTCQVSHVRCHVSYIYFFIFFWQSGGASRWRVCNQWGLPRLVLLRLQFTCLTCPSQELFPTKNRNTLMGGTLLYSAGLQKMGNVGSGGCRQIICGRTISILYHMFYKKERNYPIVRIIRLTQTLLITTTDKIGKFSNRIQCKN